MRHHSISLQKSFSTWIWGIVLIGIILMSGMSARSTPAETVSVIIITHPGVADTLSKDEVKQIFLGRKTRWANDSSVTFVLFHEPSVYQPFLREYLGKTPFQYENFWKKLVFTGKGRMPKFLKTRADVIAFVAATEGAISFVEGQGTDLDQVRTMPVTPGAGSDGI